MPQQTVKLRALLQAGSCLSYKAPSLAKYSKPLKAQLSDHYGIRRDEPEQVKDIDLVVLLFNRLNKFQSAISSITPKLFTDDEVSVISGIFQEEQASAGTSLLFSSTYLSSFDHILNLQSAMKKVTCFCSSRCLSAIHEQLRIDCADLIDRQQDSIPIFGSQDSRTIHELGDMLSNWGIYHMLAIDGDTLTSNTRHPRFTTLSEVEQDSLLSLVSLIKQLVDIILPDQTSCLDVQAGTSDLARTARLTKTFNPRLSLQTMLLPSLFTPLVAGLIKMKLDPTMLVSQWADQKLEDLLNLVDPKKLFSTLLSLSSSPSRKPLRSSSAIAFCTEVSKVLSKRLLRSAGVRGFLQAVMTHDYDEDEYDELSIPSGNGSVGEGLPNFHSTSATLNRMDSIARILCTSPQSLDSDDYFKHIAGSLLQVIAPDFQPGGLLVTCTPSNDTSKLPVFKKNNPRPNRVIKAACHVLSQIILTQPKFYRQHLGPILHSNFIPFHGYQSSSSNENPDSHLASTEDGDFDPIVVRASEISQSIGVLTILVLNSNPSEALISALILPILPQILSLWLYLRQSRSEPHLREEIDALMAVWVKLCPVEQVVEVIRRCIRELEVGRELNLVHVEGRKGWRYWSRNEGGESCIRIASDMSAFNASQDIYQIKPDPDGVADWLAGLKHEKLNSKLLIRWLDELDLLRHKEGLVEARMSLFRMQMVLKMIEKLDSSIVQDPSQILGFIKHSFSSLSDMGKEETTTPLRSLSSKKTLGGLGREVNINLPSSLGFLQAEQTEQSEPNYVNELEEEAEEEEADNSLILTGLTLLLTVLEANTSFDEQSSASLDIISEKLDYIILRCTNVRPEVNELSLKCRIMLSVRNALTQVDQLSEPHKPSNSSSAPQQLRKQILSKYEEGLKLVEDPCLPIRAQGITTLKSIICTHAKTAEYADLMGTLAPKVLDILLKMIEEEDSFIYLNAIKAISELAEQFSGLICAKLNKLYALDTFMNQTTKVPLPTDDQQGTLQLDKRLRIGEAMVQIVQRAGEALPIYLVHFLPSLLFVLSSKDFPACLRWSALTILTTCVESSMKAMLPYISDLMDSCLMILSLESRPASNLIPRTESLEEDVTKTDDANKQNIVKPISEDLDTFEDSEDEGKSKPQQPSGSRTTFRQSRPPEETARPLSKDSDHPTLRRAAVMFLLSSLSTTNVNQISESWRREYLLKSIRVLNYVKLIDPDALVQYQAGEALENLKDVNLG
ncbi:hypothetical protein CROQUDRAFT_96454 [Cronartium quercuum f. sp. fusiforme G11]|uniref:RNA polymerase II assembly factor Rtp1 C-terminal domain-containing protein n=1 Tax=Cronartium quercuum f. sp. fusiforme G11 TaxID=708437 RepID=A0A9P6T8T1_9BASI|nr:hypothetical protein CROQUDRAFT_96454 [Cronartium quercuum f. sp. fusiforme G11]